MSYLWLSASVGQFLLLTGSLHRLVRADRRLWGVYFALLFVYSGTLGVMVVRWVTS